MSLDNGSTAADNAVHARFANTSPNGQSAAGSRSDLNGTSPQPVAEVDHSSISETAGGIDITIRIGGKVVRISISGGQDEDAACGDAARLRAEMRPLSHDPPRFRAKERMIILAATDRPVARKRLIVLARQPYNSDSRAAVARLIDAGYLVVSSGGVRRGKPLPADA